LLQHKTQFKVYTKEDIPKFYHYSENPFISDIILIADPGWSLLTNNDKNWNRSKGNHGYENNFLDMHGTFIAAGPDFKKNFKTGTLWNIDIYPLLAKIFHITTRANIDGNVERIEFILKGK
jgi:hypothetical protein